MRQIAIIGAGQAGLQLSLELLQQGYVITLVNNRTPEEILNGKIMSSQAMFATALEYEKSLGHNVSFEFAIADLETQQKAIHWKGNINGPFQDIDQRLKFSRWLKVFQEKGGQFIIKDVDIS